MLARIRGHHISLIALVEIYSKSCLNKSTRQLKIKGKNPSIEPIYMIGFLC